MHTGRSFNGFKPLRPAVTFRSLTHFEHLTDEPIEGQFTSADSEQVMGFLHVRETGWIGLKVHVAAGGDLYAIPICLKSTVGMDAFDDALNVLGLTAPRIRNSLPPSGKLRWLSDLLHCLVPQLSPPHVK
jgi:hypothetical protein